MNMFTSFAPLQSQVRSHHEQLIADAARTRRSPRSRRHDNPADTQRQPTLRVVSLRSS